MGGVCICDHKKLLDEEKKEEKVRLIKMNMKEMNNEDLEYLSQGSVTILKNIEEISKHLFSQFDTDGSGHLEKDEFMKYLDAHFKLQKMDVNVNEKYIDQIFEEFDLDKNNMIEVDELQNYLTEIWKQLQIEINNELVRRLQVTTNRSTNPPSNFS
jgi:hypothetical protein